MNPRPPVPTLIHCAGGNARCAAIALRHGFQHGACLPNTTYYAPSFIDQDWRKFNKAETDQRRENLRRAYFASVERHRPALATVLDWEREDQLPEILYWADIVSQWVTEAVIIIPKVIGGIRKLPRAVNGKAVRLGYSTPTSFGETSVPLAEFRGWSVHCLGGSIAAQMRVASQIDCVSADGNYRQRVALSWCKFYSPGYPGARTRNWPILRDAGIYLGRDAIYIAFELTCIAEPMAWRGYSGHEIWDVQREYLDGLGIVPTVIPTPLFSMRGYWHES